VGAITDMMHHPFGNNYFPTEACGGAPYDADKRHCFEQRCAGVDSPPADCFAANVSEIVTQHGPQEYAVNRLQACAMDVTTERGEAWYTRYWSFVKCSEDEYDKTPEAIAASCSSGANFTDLETAYIATCFGTSAGDASVLREAKATVDHAGTPTVLVDGKESSPDSALKDVCAVYTGVKPAGCKITTEQNSWSVWYERAVEAVEAPTNTLC